MCKIDKSDVRIENLLPEHAELPHVLDLAVHLSTWTGRGGHSETFKVLDYSQF